MISLLNKKPQNLLVLLSLLTGLSLFAQLTFFYSHYAANTLIDTVVGSAIGAEILHSLAILIPLIGFVLAQIFIYVAATFALAWIATLSGEFLRLTKKSSYFLGVLLWFVTATLVVTANNYFFPDSFFAEASERTYLILIIVTSTILSLATLFAICNICKKLYKNRYFLRLGLLSVSIIGVLFYNMTPLLEKTPPAIIAARPNIILIGLDSLRPDHVSFFEQGFVNTPHLDAFLRTATNFTNSYTPLARTFPAWVSILTGMYPRLHGARGNLTNPRQLNISETLPRRLQDLGYETIFATDEKRFSNITPAFGFDEVLGAPTGLNDFLLGALNDFPLSNVLLNTPLGKKLFPYNYANRAAAITYKPNRFLKIVTDRLAEPHKKPLFFAIHLCTTHWPFTWAGERGSANLSVAEKYKKSVVEIDRQFATVIATLEKNYLLKHAIVIVLSDHGTSLGLPHDRVTTEKNYSGDPEKLGLLSRNPYVTAKKNSLDFKHEYGIDTSYGQGTDLLSLSQYQVLLSMKIFGGVQQKIARIDYPSSLIDITPTLLDLLKTPPLEKSQGVSLKPYLFAEPHRFEPRALFLETGFSIPEIETSHISPEKVLQKSIAIYQVDTQTGLVSVRPKAYQAMVASKQHAVLAGDWLLALYPPSARFKLAPAAPREKNLTLEKSIVKSFFVLVNRKTGRWTFDLDSAFAKNSPSVKLQKQLRDFYGDEIRGEQ